MQRMPGEAPSSSAVAPSSSSGLCGREVEPAPTTSRSVGPRLHATPKTVKDIEPNWMFHCRINKNDHRFQVSMDKKAEKHETWIDVYAQKYFSAGFQAHSGWRQSSATGSQLDVDQVGAGKHAFARRKG